MFEGSQIRSVWDNEREEWYFSIVDVVGVLSESKNPTDYLRKMKKRDEILASYLGTNCPKVGMVSTNGKIRKVLAGNLKDVFRIIQSIPSPKAEPFKMWLAEVGKERVDEIIDPELTIDRALESYARKGYSREWINQRLQAIQVRMSTTELILNMLAETATKDIAEATNPQGLEENKQVAQDGGSIAGDARKSIEARTGKPVITSKNAIDLGRLISDVVKHDR